MSDIGELLARLEAASEPDPHLDAEIEATLRGGIPAYRCRWGLSSPSAVRASDDAGSIWYSAPSFTGSVDAAMTLKPKGHRILIDERPYSEARHDGWRVEVYRQLHGYLSDRSDVPTYWGPTPALALCIASLKARASLPLPPEAGDG